MLLCAAELTLRSLRQVILEVLSIQSHQHQDFLRIFIGVVLYYMLIGKNFDNFAKE